jgi:membrane fusion protein (multidrug efflux system)
MTRPLLWTLSLAALAGAACSPSGGKDTTAEAGRGEVAVETGKVAAVDLEESVEVVGALSAKASADVKSEYSGVVTEVNVTQWVEVKKGQPLARLDTREAVAQLQAARAASLQAEVGAQRAARERERTDKLAEAGLATRQAVDEARTAEEAAQAQAAAVKAQEAMAATRLEKAVLRAPIDGVVSERNVNVGDYVENMGSPRAMFRIVDARVLELTASVASARMAALAVGQPLRFSSDALPGEEFSGAVSFINPAADEASRTVRIKAEIPNGEGTLRPGLFVKGRVVTGQRVGVLVVPRTALATWDTVSGTGAVYVVEGGVARRRALRTGAVSGERVEVLEGLKAGDVVVTRGGFNLRDGDKIRAIEGA